MNRRNFLKSFLSLPVLTLKQNKELEKDGIVVIHDFELEGQVFKTGTTAEIKGGRVLLPYSENKGFSGAMPIFDYPTEPPSHPLMRCTQRIRIRNSGRIKTNLGSERVIDK